MAEHTAGLLKVGGLEHDDWGMIRGADGMPLANASMQCRIPDDWPCGPTPPPEVGANARRLVACWNALVGIPTEVIEAVFSPDELNTVMERWHQTEPEMQAKIVQAFAARLVEAQKAKDALAEVCAAMLECLDTAAEHEFASRWQDDLRERARETVAKHKAASGQ